MCFKCNKHKQRLFCQAVKNNKINDCEMNMAIESRLVSKVSTVPNTACLVNHRLNPFKTKKITCHENAT